MQFCKLPLKYLPILQAFCHFDTLQLLPIGDKFSVSIDDSGYYELVVEMLSKDLKIISIIQKFGVGDVPKIVSFETTCGAGITLNKISNSCVEKQ